jgi:hypothetical protein
MELRASRSFDAGPAYYAAIDQLESDLDRVLATEREPGDGIGGIYDGLQYIPLGGVGGIETSNSEESVQSVNSEKDSSSRKKMREE